MTLATATTVVRAVRQHGGGLVHTQQPRANARGRQLTSRGGVINRRCEATSIIYSLFPSSAAAAYPLTGVRRARTLSPSLRFNSRPHAQLVVGYKLSYFPGTDWSFAYSCAVRIKTLQQFGGAASKPLDTIFHIPNSIWAFNAGRRQICEKLQATALHHEGICKINVYHFCVREPLYFLKGLPHLIKKGLRRHWIAVVIFEPLAQGFSRKQSIERGLKCPAEISPLSLISHRLISSSLTTADPNGPYDGANTSYGLYPSRSVFTTPRQTDNEINQAHNNRREAQKLTDVRKFEAYVKFPIEHCQVPVENTNLTLQAPGHYVQRGAA